MKGLQYLISLQDRVSSVADKISGKVGSLVGRMDKLTKEPNPVSIQDKVSQPAQRIANRVTSLTNRLRTLPGQARVGIQDFVSAPATRIKGNVNTLIERLKALYRQTEDTEEQTEKSSKGMGKAWKVAGIVGGLALIGSQVYNVGQAFANASMQAQGAERVIKFASGAEGAKNLEFLNGTIDRLNLPLVEARDSFAKVTGAFKDTVLQGQPMRDIFEGVSTATSAMNLSGDTTSGVFLALSQIMSKGKLSAEELTQQLGERLPGSMGIAARAMGMTTGQLFKMMERGEIMATDFLPKFAAELKKTFGEEAVKAAQTPQAQFTRLSNRFEELKIKVGNQLMPLFMRMGVVVMGVLERVIPMVDRVAKFIGDAFQGASKLFSDAFGESFGKIMAAFAALGTNLQQVIVPIQGFFSAFINLWGMLYGIFADVFEMVAGAVDWGSLLGRTFSVVGKLLGGVATILKVVWSVLKPVVGLVIDLAGWIINGLGGLVLTVLEGVTWGFTKIANGVEWVYNKIVEFLEFVGLISKKPVVVSVQQKVDTVTGKLTTIGSIPQGGAGKTNGATAPSGSTSTADSINQGGSRPVNINIKYDSLIKGGITINSTTLKEGAKDIEKIIIETLLRSLNGATQIATQ